MINKQAKITATVILAAFLLSFIAIFIVSGLENNSILLDDVAQDSINNSITFEFTEDTKTFYLDLEKQDYTKAEIDITGINISDLSIDILANDEIDFNVNEFNSKETLNFLDLLIPYIDNCGIYPCNIPFTVVASTGILIFDNLVLEYGEIEEVIEENITEEIEEAIEINETIEEIIDEKIEEVIEENITEEIEEAIVEETSIENQTNTTERGDSFNSLSFGGGDGTPTIPYQITNCTNLNKTRNNLTAYYILTTDIDFSDAACSPLTTGKGFAPIGNISNTFNGSFNGQNYTITGLFISRTTEDYTGLFGYIDNGSVFNLGLIDSNITGRNYTGALAGWNNGNITEVYSTNNINGTNNLGGLVGINNGTIINSYSITNITGADFVGGIAGYNNGNITKSFAVGNITGTSNLGGLIGINHFNLNHSFTASNVTGTTVLGALVGNNQGAITNSYFNNHTGNPNDCYNAGNTGCTAIDNSEGYFKGNVYSNSAPFSNWSFFDIWQERFNSYPVLTWQSIGQEIIWSGLGTYPNPYSVTNCIELQNMSTNLTSYYQLTQNIDCSATSTWNLSISYYRGFEPIGNDFNVFSGSLDGNNYTIDKLYINRSAESGIGLFGRISGNLSNLGLTNANITGGNTVGGLAGTMWSRGNLSNSYVTGNITGNNIVGGLFGYFNSKTIDSYSTANVNGNNTVGGLMGWMIYDTLPIPLMNRTYSTGNINGSNKVGGLVGSCTGTVVAVRIQNSFVTGSVSANKINVGGLVGYHEYVYYYDNVINSYYNNHSGNPDNCYTSYCSNIDWESFCIAEGCSWAGGACTGTNYTTSYTCSAIQDNENYFKGDVYSDNQPIAGWDFYNTWQEVENDYPHLTLENLGGIYTPGSGTALDPYNISDCHELQDVRSNLTAYYILTEDVDFNDNDCNLFKIGFGFEPIGNTTTKFTGTFDGNNNTISNLYINRSTENYVGLFGYIDTNINITNLGLENTDITGGNFTGALVGYNKGNLRKTYSKGDINGTNEVGGLVGYSNKGNINNSYSTANVNGSSNTGGLIGNNELGNVLNSYSTGALTGKNNIGGLAGNNTGNITNAYTVGNVNGTTKGSLVGNNTGNITNSYWNNNSLNPDDCYNSGNDGCTVVQNNEAYFYDISQSPMSNWDFVYAWDNIFNALDHPSLLWQGLGEMSGSGTSIDPYNITTCVQLQNIKKGLGSYYALTQDINCSATSSWNSEVGFEPIGDDSTKFRGGFDGRNYTIINLKIDRSAEDYVGLFGYVGANVNITNFGLEGVNIKGNKFVGGIAGYNNGSIIYTYLTGNINGTTEVGGLIGNNQRELNSSYILANINGTNSLGGLVGNNTGNITNSYAIGNVSGSSFIGGLTSYNNGNITNSYSIINLSTSSINGSLVGKNDGTITNSYWNNHTSNPKNCTDSGNPAGCNVIQNSENYFYFQTNAPMTSWNFKNKWVSDGLGIPLLQLQTFTNITRCAELQLVKNNLTRHYELENNINCSDTINWNSGSGFKPISGQCIKYDIGLCLEYIKFSGIFDGNNYTIDGIYMNRTEVYVGLFGYVSSGNITNLGLENISINNSYSGEELGYVGGLVGYNEQGIINNSHAIGNVSANGSRVESMGGLVGRNELGIIDKSYTIGNINSTRSSVDTGGLVGYNDKGNISRSYSHTNVTSIGWYVGGLVGFNMGGGYITKSYATGNVNGSIYVGGLVGWNGHFSVNTYIYDSYATGNVFAFSTSGDAGGLVGYNKGNISNSYATGNVNTTGNYAGGLVGHHQYGTINNSFATGNVSANRTEYVGGLVGLYSEGNIINSFFNNKTGNPSRCAYNNDGSVDCIPVQNNENYFKNDVFPPAQGREPFDNWNYTNTWIERPNDFPILRWQGIGNSVQNTNLSFCARLTSSNSTYNLLENITWQKSCFNIDADNITFNGSGLEINGSDNADYYGFYSSNTRNITIKNITINDFGKGIFFNKVNYSFIQNSSIISCTTGIDFDSYSYNNTLIDNQLSNNTLDMSFGLEALINFNVTNFTLELKNTNFAGIKWNNQLTFNATSFNNIIQFSNNLISLDSSTISALNSSATLTMYNTDSLGFNLDRWPLRNSVRCDTTNVCTELTEADTYIFNVTHFTDYSVGGLSSGGSSSGNSWQEEILETVAGLGEDVYLSDEIEEIKRVSKVSHKRKIEAKTLEDAILSLEFKNEGIKKMKDLEINLEQPAPEKELIVLHPTKVQGWDKIDMLGWTLNSNVKDLGLLEWNVSKPKQIDSLSPGESLNLDLDIKPPLTRQKEVDLKLKITSYGQVIYEEIITVEINQSHLVVVPKKHEDDNLVDLFMIVSNLEEKDNKYNIELNINSKEESKTVVTELYGPFKISKNDTKMFAYQYQYTDKFIGDYNAVFSLYNENKKVKTVETSLDLRR